jgi:hypothetical protein
MVTFTRIPYGDARRACQDHIVYTVLAIVTMSILQLSILVARSFRR